MHILKAFRDRFGESHGPVLLAAGSAQLSAQSRVNRLYAVTLDSWDPNEPADQAHPQLPPPQMTYRDATAVFESNIPLRKIIMYKTQGVLTGGAALANPVPVVARLNRADFFEMFAVPFLYGAGWNAAADQSPARVSPTIATRSA